MYKKPRKASGVGRVAEVAVAEAADEKVLKTFRLAPGRLIAAQRALGASTATETIERALDYVLFTHGLIEGTRDLLGMDIISPDPAV